MATLLARLTVHPGTEERFEEIIAELHRRTHADEDAVLRYDYWRAAEPRTYYAFMSYPDHRSFIDHQVSDHHEAAAADFAGVIDTLALEWVDPVGGASQLPPTDPQESPADADDLRRTYTERFAASTADWWLALR